MIRRFLARPSFWAPALLSMGLSLSCLGDRAYWQDSGFYLTAVKEFTALYPPGFVLYLLLCKAWTLLLGFIDFTRSVHLFSAVCAAAAAGTIGVAVGEFLRARSGFLQAVDGQADPVEEYCGAGTGMLAATGFTFWFAGTYAKGYSLLYFVLALLIRQMGVAAERRRPRDFSGVALLIGLAWQAHPSATGAGLALLLFVGAHAKLLGWKGVAGRVLLAAAAALGPALLLPWLTPADATMSFGEPRTAGEVIRYVAGSSFTQREGAFGFQASRWVTAAEFFWEEFLVVGLALAAVGTFQLARARRPLLPGIILWAVPYTVLPTLFILEGQQDHWYVAAWIPIYLLVGAGLYALGRRFGKRGIAVAVALGASWAVVANRADLDQRSYDLAEVYGRIHLEPLAERGLLMATSDETSALGHYLQKVRGLRPDVIVVRRGYLDEASGWYDRRLLLRDPSLKLPDYRGVRARFPRAEREAVVMAAFANANVTAKRPVYFEKPPPLDMLRDDYVVVPAGPLLKMVPKGQETLDNRYWSFPIEPEAVRPLFRRARGQDLLDQSGPMRSKTEPYEQRLLLAMVRARFLLADWHFRRGSMAPARDLFEAVLRGDPETGTLDEVVFPLAMACAAVGPLDRAEALFRSLLARPLDLFTRSRSFFYLGEIAAATGRSPYARECWGRALESLGPQGDPGFRAEIQKRLGPR